MLRSLAARPSQVMAEVSGSGPGRVPDVNPDMVSLSAAVRSSIKAILPASVNIACRAFRCDGAVYLLVCNTSEVKVEGKVKVKWEEKGTVEALEDLLYGIAVKIEDGIISLSLPPMGVAMIRLKESK